MESCGLKKKKKDGRMIFFYNGSMHGFLEEEDGNLIKKKKNIPEAENFSFLFFLKFWSSSPFFVSSRKFVIPKVGVAFFHVN